MSGNKFACTGHLTKFDVGGVRPWMGFDIGEWLA